MSGTIRPGVSSLFQTATQVVNTAKEIAKTVSDQVTSAAQNAASTAQSVFEAASNAAPLVDLSGGTPAPVQDPVVRDGSPATALGWANERLGNTGYDEQCLDFVKGAYAIHQTAARSPEINFASGTNNAIGAFNGLEANGKIVPPDSGTPLRAGDIVFFGADEKNDMDGHICIATGNTAADGTPEVITSGYPGAPGVHLSSIGQLSEASGPYIGHTTPELAFAEGTWPGSAEATSPRPTSTQGATNPAGNAPQAWNNTCGANALMSMEAAVDPERAAQLAAMSPQERAEYEGAVLRSDPENLFTLGTRPDGTTKGWGTYMMGLQVSERFGGEATKIEPFNRSQAVDALTTQLAEGKPVAIGLAGHWMSATAMRDGESGRELLIHDSWTGTSAWVPEADLRQPGSGWVRTHFPGAPFEGAIQSLVAPGQPVLEPGSVYREAEASMLEGVRAEMR